MLARTYYSLGVAYEASGWDDKAAEQNALFPDIWKDADPGLDGAEDAGRRLAASKSKS